MVIGKKGQIELTFNWMYVLIAGTVILLFFVGIVVKQKAASEQRLSIDVLRVMDSIFVGSGVSEKTKNFIDISGLADYTLYFDCGNGVGHYGLKGTTADSENAVDPIFAPGEIQGTQLIVWSLPYKLPFKVIDFLFVSSSNSIYYLFSDDTDFANEFSNVTQGFNVKYTINSKYNEIDPGKSFQVRLIDNGGLVVKKNGQVPLKLKGMDDDKVSAVVFTGTNQVDYYQKEGALWRKLNFNPVQIISLGGERDAAKYGAVFAANDKDYQCNMKKAFVRLKYLNEVYSGADIALGKVSGKLGEMVEYYDTHKELELTRPDCIGNVKKYDPNLVALMQTHQLRVSACLLQQSSCADLINSAQDIKKVNTALGVDCITLY